MPLSSDTWGDMIVPKIRQISITANGRKNSSIIPRLPRCPSICFAKKSGGKWARPTAAIARIRRISQEKRQQTLPWVRRIIQDLAEINPQRELTLSAKDQISRDEAKLKRGL